MRKPCIGTLQLRGYARMLSAEAFHMHFIKNQAVLRMPRPSAAQGFTLKRFQGTLHTRLQCMGSVIARIQYANSIRVC